ncbi:hypothetical protein AMECASPLE_009587, partial [Ameca splendens]
MSRRETGFNTDRQGHMYHRYKVRSEIVYLFDLTGGRGDSMAAEWDEQQAYEELLYWDGLIQQGHRLLPEDFDRYEELRYWYDCLCYKEELRQYHEYISAVKELEDKRQLE